MKLECLTKKDTSVRYEYCSPDWHIGSCSPADQCGPDYGEDCMPDCGPDND